MAGLARHLQPRPQHWLPRNRGGTRAICCRLAVMHCLLTWQLLFLLLFATDSAPDSPLNCDAGNLLRGGDLRGYNSLARMYTLELAQPRAR